MNDVEYRKLAEIEDRMWFFRSLHAHMDRALSRSLLSGRSYRILDAGCGAGGLIKGLSLKHPDWIYRGIDLSSMACDFSRQRTGAEVVLGNIESMPYAAAEFDAIVSADVLCQVDDPSAAAKEFYRILRPGAVCVLNLPAYPSLWSYHDQHCGNKRRYQAEEIRELLSTAGFRGIQTTHWNALAFPLIWYRRKIARPRATTDVEMPSRPVEALMRLVMALEHAWIDFGFSWSWGSSLFVVARKPLAEERR
jgi:SAM-dependent methyltransferase